MTAIGVNTFVQDSDLTMVVLTGLRCTGSLRNPVVENTLPEAISKALENSGSSSHRILAIVGDILEEPNSTAVNQAFEVIERSAKAIGCPLNEVLIVPGERDLRADVSDLVFVSSTRPQTALAEPLQHIERLIERESQFTSLVHLLGQGNFVADLVPPVWTRSVVGRSTRITIVALDSALMSRGEPTDRGRLVIGGPRLRDFLNECSTVGSILAIVHHPLDWLADSQRELVEILSDDANLIVTGHWIDSGFGQSELCSASNARATIVSPATDQLELRIINVGFEPLAVDTAAWIWNTETLDWVLIEPRRLQKEPSTSGLRKFDPDSIETLQGPTPRGVEVNPISLPFEIPNFSQTDRQPDFAVLAALPWEMDAFLRHMGSCTEVKCPSPSVRTYYGCTTVTGTSLIVSRALGMGPLHAASLARDVADQWRPRFIILVGIAAGIGKEVRLGDIAVAKQIVNYDPARLTAAGVDRRFEVYRSDPILLDKVIHLRESAWISQLTVRRPDNQLSQTPRVHSGVILSGNAVVADESTADDLQSIWNKAIALEMESGGMATSLHELPNPPGFIVVKGISDFANSQKSDEWQLYAADASAALAAELVRTAI